MKKGKLWVVAPVFDDWDSAAELVDTVKSLNTNFCIKIVLVDDASKVEARLGRQAVDGHRTKPDGKLKSARTKLKRSPHSMSLESIKSTNPS